MPQKALLIGVNDYAFAPLSSCVNDATAMRDRLVALDVFKANECTLMTSPATPGSAAPPTRDAILDWLLPLYESNPPLGRLLVYFAGHGLSVRLGREADALRTALVPAGVDSLNNAGGRMIDLDELLGRFARRGAQEQNWIIDACRNLPPDDVVPNIATIGWDTPKKGDPRDAFDMAQTVLYAVSPLGKASAVKDGYGVLTGHLLDGLACKGEAQWGAGGWYDERDETWQISLGSLCKYARRRIDTTIPADSWQRKYLLPQVWQGEREAGPLRDAGPLPDRPFSLFIEPATAAPDLSVSLSVRRNKVAAWPPRDNGQAVLLQPGPYRIAALLSQGVNQWQPPKFASPIVDLCETDRMVLRVEPVPQPDIPPAAPPDTPGGSDGGSFDGVGGGLPFPLSERLGLPFDGDVGIPTPSAVRQPDPFNNAPTVAPANGTELPVPPVFVQDPGSGRPLPPGIRFLVAPEAGHYEVQPPVLVVHAMDPGATVRLTRLSGGRERRYGKIETPIELSEGLWRVEVMLGNDVIAVREEDVGAGNRYDVTATAQITPALAALLSGQAAFVQRDTNEPPKWITPSETIGPMQGAILPTLLPMLALKPFDAADMILSSFSPMLSIPLVPGYPIAPVAVVIAFDGAWDVPGDSPRDQFKDEPPLIRALAAGTTVDAGGPVEAWWRDHASARVSLYVSRELRTHVGIVLSVPGWGRLQVGAPSILPGHCTVVAVTLWQDGRWDLSVSLFVMPPGFDQIVRPGRLSRALAIAARFYRARATLDDVDYDVLSLVSQGSWGDPVLGALAWFANNRDRSLLDPEQRARRALHQQNVRMFLNGRVPRLTDTRVIEALSQPEPLQVPALDALLADLTLSLPVLAEPVAVMARHALAHGQTDHWCVARFQHLPPDAVFNAIRLDPLPDSALPAPPAP